MEETLLLKDLNCANCAAKMEDAIKKIEGVVSAKVNFMAQKLTVEANDEHFNAIMDEAQRVCHKIEPDCDIVR